MMKDYLKRMNAFLHRQKPISDKEGNIGKRVLETEGTYFSGHVISDIGCVRLTNEDNYVICKHLNANLEKHSEVAVPLIKTFGEWKFAGVFDGMGGGEMGELAAHDTAEIFIKAFCELDKDKPKAEVDYIIRKAFLEANNKIIALQKQYRVYGTTGTIVCSNGFDFKIYHLGDSRAYLFRENDLFLLTRDQTLAQMKIETGMYSPDAPDAEADKHKLTEYIGRDRTLENIRPVESHWIPILHNDLIVLCSDGLYDMCTDEEIAGILRKNTDVKIKCEMLINKAREHGGIDNITCVLILLGS